MPTPTYLSPGFFDREIDASAPAPQGPVGVPAGVIGTANHGPAFVPVTVGNWSQFTQVFGTLDPKCFGPYAAYFFLANRSSLTFMRVLGAGANANATDIARTTATGRTVNAGFHLDGTSVTGDTRKAGIVQFLAAVHVPSAAEAFGPAIFTDNDSFTSGSAIHLVRSMIMTPSTARIMVADGNKDFSVAGRISGLADWGAPTGVTPGYFKLIISSSLGSSFYNDDGNPGCHILTASLNPTDANYVGKLLNTSPDNFVAAQHLLYADFAVDNEIASVSGTVGILSGTANISANNTDSSYTGAPYNDTTTFLASFGAFDSRYRTPKTTFFISQPFGKVEYDLFAFEALDDGQYANNLYKISIVNLQASTNPAHPFGTFAVQIRSFNDTDVNPNVLEQFNNCSLDPTAANYIAAVVGDRKVSFNFDTTLTEEQRIITSGKYPNQSSYVRVVMNSQVDTGVVPQTVLPFGFRGLGVLNTNNLNDATGVQPARIGGILSGSGLTLAGAILPPVPYRAKVTKGPRNGTQWFGEPGSLELASPLYYWGTVFERLDIPTDPNLETAQNALLTAYTKFMGATGLDTQITGSAADLFNNNKFTLANVAFSNAYTGVDLTNILTSSIDTHMREAAYIRNGKPDGTTYTIHDTVMGNRITFATLLGSSSVAQFNRFTPYLKFTNLMGGGWDGINMLDPDASRQNDYATSFAGEAASGFSSPGFTFAQGGAGQSNSVVSSYITAINVMTDALQVNHNVLCVPGIREPFVTDYAGQKVRDYGLAYFVMDLEKFDESSNRLFDTTTGSNGSPARPDVAKTASGLATRAIDNNYMGTYFPDVFVQDPINKRRIKVPSSVAAMGALGFNDRVGYPWFAPAGFNRASLDFVTNVEIRLNSADRDTLYSSRINPIATFPRQGFVIFGQKTLQASASALDRVNVRRLILEVKRIIMGIAMKLEFETNTPDVWSKFVSQAILQLGLIQAQAGIEAFQVIMNETNNPDAADSNQLFGRIVVVPTRVIEFIAIDFVITNSGVQFM